MRPCGKATESRARIVEEHEVNKEERNVSEEDVRAVEERDVGIFWYTR